MLQKRSIALAQVKTCNTSEDLSETDPHRRNLSDKIYLKTSDIYVALSYLSIYYT